MPFREITTVVSVLAAPSRESIIDLRENSEFSLVVCVVGGPFLLQSCIWADPVLVHPHLIWAKTASLNRTHKWPVSERIPGARTTIRTTFFQVVKSLTPSDVDASNPSTVNQYTHVEFPPLLFICFILTLDDRNPKQNNWLFEWCTIFDVLNFAEIIVKQPCALFLYPQLGRDCEGGHCRKGNLERFFAPKY